MRSAGSARLSSRPGSVGDRPPVDTRLAVRIETAAASCGYALSRTSAYIASRKARLACRASRASSSGGVVRRRPTRSPVSPALPRDRQRPRPESAQRSAAFPAPGATHRQRADQRIARALSPRSPSANAASAAHRQSPSARRPASGVTPSGVRRARSRARRGGECEILIREHSDQIAVGGGGGAGAGVLPRAAWGGGGAGGGEGRAAYAIPEAQNPRGRSSNGDRLEQLA